MIANANALADPLKLNLRFGVAPGVAWVWSFHSVWAVGPFCASVWRPPNGLYTLDSAGRFLF